MLAFQKVCDFYNSFLRINWQKLILTSFSRPWKNEIVAVDSYV